MPKPTSALLRDAASHAGRGKGLPGGAPHRYQLAASAHAERILRPDTFDRPKDYLTGMLGQLGFDPSHHDLLPLSLLMVSEHGTHPDAIMQCMGEILDAARNPLFRKNPAKTRLLGYDVCSSDFRSGIFAESESLDPLLLVPREQLNQYALFASLRHAKDWADRRADLVFGIHQIEEV